MMKRTLVRSGLSILALLVVAMSSCKTYVPLDRAGSTTSIPPGGRGIVLECDRKDQSKIVLVERSSDPQEARVGDASAGKRFDVYVLNGSERDRFLRGDPITSHLVVTTTGAYSTYPASIASVGASLNVGQRLCFGVVNTGDEPIHVCAYRTRHGTRSRN